MKKKGRYQTWMIWGVSFLFGLLPCVGYGADLTIGNTTVSTTGNLTVNGTISATSFVGGGSGLTGVDKRTAMSACETISTSGSYYLTQNLSITGATCITVIANDVTIDLNGFALTGNNTASTFGVYINNVSNVEVSNGTIRQFDSGIEADYISPNTTSSNRVINVRAESNTTTGIQLESVNNMIRNCISSNNLGWGIADSGGSTITGNITYSNSYDGIHAYNGSTITGNASYKNGQNGIVTSTASTITGNTTYNNNWNGIYVVGNGSAVIGNTVSYNNQSNSPGYGGIFVYDANGNTIKGNTLAYNSMDNITLRNSAHNAIEENLLTYSGNGISFEVSGNFYANNRASNNTTNYNLNGTTQIDGGGNVGF